MLKIPKLDQEDQNRVTPQNWFINSINSIKQSQNAKNDTNFGEDLYSKSMSHKESLAIFLFGYFILNQDSIAWPALTTPFPQSACCDEEQEYYLQIQKERTELNSLFKQMKDFLYHYKHLQLCESLKDLYSQLLSLNKIKAFKNTHLKMYDFIN